MHRLGLLSTAPGPHGGTINFPVLVDASRELGYEEGRNLIIERRFVRLGTDRPNDLADDLVRARVDVIVATNNLYIAAAKQATSTIPIVMVFGLDPVGSGFVDSFGRPGRNITGMTWDASPEIAAKQLELLREVAPSASSVAVL